MKYRIFQKNKISLYDVAYYKKMIQLVEKLQKNGYILLSYDSVYKVSECDDNLSKDFDFVLFIGFNEEERQYLNEIVRKDYPNVMVEEKMYGMKLRTLDNFYYFITEINGVSLDLLHDIKETKLHSSDSMLSSLVVKLCGIRKNNLEEVLQKLSYKDPTVIITTDRLEVKKNPNVCEGSLKDEDFGEVIDVSIYLNKILEDEKESELWKSSIKEEFQKNFGSKIYSFCEKESLESLLIDKLKKKGLTLTAAESCTGGLFMANMINVSGASSVIDRSFVTYANEAKEQLIGVSHETIDSYGAVSKQTAGEMARGAAKVANADVAIAITGIAGPLGGTEKKPVGTVYLSCYYKEKTHTILLLGTGSRDEIRNQTVQMAKSFLLRVLLEGEL